MLLGFGIITLNLGIATAIGYIMPETVIPVTEEEITTYTEMLRNFQSLQTRDTHPNPHKKAFALIEASLPENIYLDVDELYNFIHTSLPIYSRLGVTEQLIYNKYMATALTLNEVDTAQRKFEINEVTEIYNRNIKEVYSIAQEYRNLPKYESPVLPILGIIASVTILTGVIIYKTYNRY